MKVNGCRNEKIFGKEIDSNGRSASLIAFTDTHFPISFIIMQRFLIEVQLINLHLMSIESFMNDWKVLHLNFLTSGSKPTKLYLDLKNILKFFILVFQMYWHKFFIGETHCF